MAEQERDCVLQDFRTVRPNFLEGVAEQWAWPPQMVYNNHVLDNDIVFYLSKFCEDVDKQ